MARATVGDVLGPQGELAQLLPQWESRPQQLAMAELIADGLRRPSHVVCEAPTGVGKSFAYLVPAMQHALTTGGKVVVSTATIALQEQLMTKDIPLLQRVFPEVIAVLVKGRQNFLSRRRLQRAFEGQQALFETRDEARELARIAAWAESAEATGDRSDLGWEPSLRVWELVRSDRRDCLGRKCPHYERCFFYGTRERMRQAHLLVVNHHLYCSDLGLQERGGGLLPPHDAVIFDEAHALEGIASEHLGLTVTAAQVRWYLDTLWSVRGKGLLADPRWETARSLVAEARQANEALWAMVSGWLRERSDETLRLTAAQRVEEPLTPALSALAEALLALRERSDDDHEHTLLTAQAEHAEELAAALTVILRVEDDGLVRFATVPRDRHTPSLAAQPLDIAPILAERLFSRMRCVVLTSATLAAGSGEDFAYIRERLGVGACLRRRLDSPFDYARQARLLVNEEPIDPNSEAFSAACAQWLPRYLAEAEGGVFVLFTNYTQLRQVYEGARAELEALSRPVLRQGGGIERSQMLQLFRSAGNAVLFGTASFWEGVDVPGNALQHVIIAKLPFQPPHHPLAEARIAALRRAGRNPFLEWQVPEAVIRFKQGFGRLIRTRSDRGTLVVLDHRVCTAHYGRLFLEALPPLPITRFRLCAET
ncbi:MAG: helicase C-terminal domain-containing protein [Planctomycetota bacterium]|nr:DEAD/DEAH box helicase [Planctomycetota bacterium]MCX8040014.1 DEAD/DEAH box helicase [Planctomycetota bacterium]MDW8372614.1 helicase C-terminal domain-containing protein [Planctomycetota bacterium]